MEKYHHIFWRLTALRCRLPMLNAMIQMCDIVLWDNAHRHQRFDMDQEYPPPNSELLKGSILPIHKLPHAILPLGANCFLAWSNAGTDLREYHGGVPLEGICLCTFRWYEEMHHDPILTVCLHSHALIWLSCCIGLTRGNLKSSFAMKIKICYFWKSTQRQEQPRPQTIKQSLQLHLYAFCISPTTSGSRVT